MTNTEIDSSIAVWKSLDRAYDAQRISTDLYGNGQASLVRLWQCLVFRW